MDLVFLYCLCVIFALPNLRQSPSTLCLMVKAGVLFHVRACAIILVVVALNLCGGLPVAFAVVFGLRRLGS